MTFVRLDGEDILRRNLTRLEQRVFPQAMARSLNNAAVTVRKVSVKDIAGATGHKQQAVRRRVVIRKRANRKDLVVIIEATGRPLNLIEFGARPLKRGVSAKPWGRRQRFTTAFIARMPNGQDIVVRRMTNGKKIQSGPNKGRAALQAMFGPGIANEATQPALDEARRDVIRQRMPIELARELKFRVSKL